MTLEQLRMFVAIAEHENVTQGAKALNVTQSTSSKAIAALERQYATRLFDRVGRHIVLTEVGRQFFAKAKAILCQVEDAERSLTETAERGGGSIAISSTSGVLGGWLPRLIQRYQEIHPFVSIKMVSATAEVVAGHVRDGLANIGFVDEEIDDPNLVIRQVKEYEFVLFAPVAHPWSRQAPRTTAELKDGRWVSRERGSIARISLEESLQRWSLAPAELNVALEYPTDEAVRAAVESGSGVAVTTRSLAENAILAGRVALVEFPISHMQHKFYMLTYKNRYQSSAVSMMCDSALSS